jgi:hypothetical protein
MTKLRTRLTYHVDRDTEWDDRKGKVVTFTVPGTQAYDFEVPGCVSEREENLIENSFAAYLRDRAIVPEDSIFGGDSNEYYIDAETGIKTENICLTVAVTDGEEKREAREAYVRWKADVLPSLIRECEAKRKAAEKGMCFVKLVSLKTA